MRKSNPGARRNLPHIMSRLFDAPLMMHPRKLRSIVGVLGMEMGITSYLQSDIVAATGDDFLTVHSHPSVPAGCGISVIPIHGTLVQRGDSLDAMSGLRSYESIREDFREALADASTDAILLDIDSGGGEVAGLFDLVDEIAAADKPVYAFANENAYSAAYAIASAADRVYVARTGGVGSIGIVGVHIDQSGFDQKSGITYTPIYAGARKVDGWPHAPLSDEARAEYQKSVDSNYQLFVETVAQNRELSEKAVRDTQAGCFTADESIKAGLADGVAGFDEVVEIIAQDLQRSAAPQGFSGQGGLKANSGPSGDSETGVTTDMARQVLKGKGKSVKAVASADDLDPEKKEKPADAVASGEDDEETEAKDKKDTDAAADTVDDETDEDEAPEKKGDPADTDAKPAALHDAAEIADLCLLYGKPSLASDFIRKGVSAAAVRNQLLKQRNDEANAERAAGKTVSAAHGGGTQVVNETRADMERRFKKKK